MKVFNDNKLTSALKEYDLTDSITPCPVTFSEEFDVKMEKLIRKKQRSYNIRVHFQHIASAFLLITLLGALFYILFQQHNTNNELTSLTNTTHVTTPPQLTKRGNIYDRNGVLLVSSRLSDDGNYYIREDHTEYASHLLGYDGVVLVFDEFLRGADINGEQASGQHVYLTIDLELQKVAENALREQIERVNLERDEADVIPGGAVVVTNVNTGEILAAASYPTYELNRFSQGTYSPGGAFKMVTTLAGFRNIIPRATRSLVIDDTGIFNKYEDVGMVYHCWFYNTHGLGHRELNIVQALECSCDFFFIQLTDSMMRNDQKHGARMLADAAKEFGLGIATGLEIPESEGHLPLPEAREARSGYKGWYIADTLLAGIGHGENRYTPVQLANYAATIANGGTLYSLSLLHNVKSSDYSKEVIAFKPNVRGVIEETDIIDIIQEGMLAVSRGKPGTARLVFGDYPINVASKTGTIQVDGNPYNSFNSYNDGAIIDGVFVAYAPAEKPEIAISVVLEKGGSGSAVIEISRIIFDHFFGLE